MAAGKEAVRTRHGLLVYPDLDETERASLSHVQTVGPEIDTLRKIIDRVRSSYGASTAHLVAIQMDYPEAAEGNF